MTNTIKALGLVGLLAIAGAGCSNSVKTPFALDNAKYFGYKTDSYSGEQVLMLGNEEARVYNKDPAFKASEEPTQEFLYKVRGYVENGTTNATDIVVSRVDNSSETALAEIVQKRAEDSLARHLPKYQ